MLSTDRTGSIVPPLVGQHVPRGSVRVTWDGSRNGAILPSTDLALIERTDGCEPVLCTTGPRFIALETPHWHGVLDTLDQTWLSWGLPDAQAADSVAHKANTLDGTQLHLADLNPAIVSATPASAAASVNETNVSASGASVPAAVNKKLERLRAGWASERAGQTTADLLARWDDDHAQRTNAKQELDAMTTPATYDEGDYVTFVLVANVPATVRIVEIGDEGETSYAFSNGQIAVYSDQQALNLWRPATPQEIELFDLHAIDRLGERVPLPQLRAQ